MELIEEVIEDPNCVFIFPEPAKVQDPLIRIEDG
jgi:ATP-binding cassette subfamily F protein 3